MHQWCMKVPSSHLSQVQRRTMPQSMHGLYTMSLTSNKGQMLPATRVSYASWMVKNWNLKMLVEIRGEPPHLDEMVRLLTELIVRWYTYTFLAVDVDAEGQMKLRYTADCASLAY